MPQQIQNLQRLFDFGERVSGPFFDGLTELDFACESERDWLLINQWYAVRFWGGGGGELFI